MADRHGYIHRFVPFTQPLAAAYKDNSELPILGDISVNRAASYACFTFLLTAGVFVASFTSYVTLDALKIKVTVRLKQQHFLGLRVGCLVESTR